MKFYNKIGKTWVQWDSSDLNGDWTTPIVIVVLFFAACYGLICLIGYLCGWLD